MKRFFLLLAVGSIGFSTVRAQGNQQAATTSASSSITSLAIGDAIPQAQVMMKGTQNEELSLEKARTDKGLLVMFSCNTCPYVIKSQPRTREVIRFAKENGIGMVILNSNSTQRDHEDSFEAMVAYAKTQGYTVPYLLDKDNLVANAFGASRTPEVYLFDASGKLVYKGAMEDNPSDPSASKSIYIKDAISNMLSSKKIDPNSTKSIGCTIKRS